MSTEIPETGLRHLGSGKVRERYELDDDRLVFVTTDRISAFDVVMDEPIRNKGHVLSAMTSFWFDELVDIVPSHEAEFNPDVLPGQLENPYFQGRTVVVKRADMLPLECIVRGHLTGSAWEEYEKSGTVHGMPAPKDMMHSQNFPEPIFTPSTKEEDGHDVNISFDEAVEIVGGETAEQLRTISLEIFKRMYKRGEESGIIIADTKFEFGMIAGRIALCDEVGTPDSSRFWPEDLWWPGSFPPSFDKQYLRDYLKALVDAGKWNKKAPPPPLPEEIVANTAQKYQEGYERITGLRLTDWPGVQA